MAWVTCNSLGKVYNILANLPRAIITATVTIVAVMIHIFRLNGE